MLVIIFSGGNRSLTYIIDEIIKGHYLELETIYQLSSTQTHLWQHIHCSIRGRSDSCDRSLNYVLIEA